MHELDDPPPAVPPDATAWAASSAHRPSQDSTGSHFSTPPSPEQVFTQTWDDDFDDLAHPPEGPAWIPPGYSGVWTTTQFGLDAAGSAVAEGRDRIAALGLTNATLLHADLLDARDLGTFDYVIAHGLYSWVPEPVREKILSICRGNLADRGFAYVSYNALPGCHIRRVIRDLLLFHAGPVEDPAERIRQARAQRGQRILLRQRCHSPRTHRGTDEFHRALFGQPAVLQQQAVKGQQRQTFGSACGRGDALDVARSQSSVEHVAQGARAGTQDEWAGTVAHRVSDASSSHDGSAALRYDSGRAQATDWERALDTTASIVICVAAVAGLLVAERRASQVGKWRT